MTTIYHGWTQDNRPQPANKAQLIALLELLINKPRSELRDKAVDALDNAIDCLTYFAAEQEAADYADLIATQEAARF